MGNNSEKINFATAGKANLQPADVIKISRYLRSGCRDFYHFAVYVGDGYIIHLKKTRKPEFCKCPADLTFAEDNTATECKQKQCGKNYKFIFASEPLEFVLDESEFLIASNRDGDIRPRDAIVERATRYSEQSLIKWFKVKRYEKKIKKMENSYMHGIIKAINTVYDNRRIESKSQ